MLWPTTDGAVSFQMHDTNLWRLLCTRSEHSSITQSSRGFLFNEGKHYRCFDVWNVKRANDWSGIALPTILSILVTAYKKSFIHKQRNIIEKDSADGRGDEFTNDTAAFV
jgi:hypothetical protein